MCGIAGYLDTREPTSEPALAAMVEALRHRGPDRGGTWRDREVGIGLGHRRLAIVDLSENGDQPAFSPSGRLIVTYNGEIYNHTELRTRLQPPPEGWKGHSDTETLAAALEQMGIESTLESCVGMFAFAAWDRERRSLTLARDRLGEKPLYYGWQGNSLLFASELKALKRHPAFLGEIDRRVAAGMIERACVYGTSSVFAGIRRLPAGSFVTISKDDRQPEARRYWSIERVAEAGQRNLFPGDVEQASAELEKLLLTSIGGQVQADVPVGAFLSGGIDSSTIVALMQARAKKPVRTFNVGFGDRDYDESAAAAGIARHLGTQHTSLRLAPSDVLDEVPNLARVYDEPFADVSQLPTLLMTRVARREVTVALSGDGGDELFGGYNRYLAAGRLWRRTRALGRPVRRLTAAALRRVSPRTWKSLSRLLPAGTQYAERAGKVADILEVDSHEEFYGRMLGTPIAGAFLDDVEHHHHPMSSQDFEPEQRMMLADAQGYLPDDVLVKLDRAAMSSSLETRLPFLDHRVVEFAWSLPLEMKIHQGLGKRVLRHMLSRFVPPPLLSARKVGFSVPIDDWLRCELRDWAEALLDPGAIRSQGMLDVVVVRRLWQEHQSGRHNFGRQLWPILMLQAWLVEQAT